MRCWPSCCGGGARAGRSGWRRSSATWRSAPRPAGASMLVGPDGEAVGSVSGGCVEGAVYELAQEVVAIRRPVAAAVRHQRRRRVRGRPDLRRHPRRVRREGRPGDVPRADDVAADIDAGRPVAVCTVIEHPDPARVGRRLVVRPDAPRRSSLGSSRADDAVTDDARGLLAAGRTDDADYGPDGERRGEGMRVFVVRLRAQAADARLRRDRLRRGRRPGGRVPRLRRDGLRRPPGLRDRRRGSRTPTRSSSTGRTATWPPRRTPAGSTAAP